MRSPAIRETNSAGCTARCSRKKRRNMKDRASIQLMLDGIRELKVKVCRATATMANETIWGAGSLENEDHVITEKSTENYGKTNRRSGQRSRIIRKLRGKRLFTAPTRYRAEFEEHAAVYRGPT